MERGRKTIPVKLPQAGGVLAEAATKARYLEADAPEMPEPVARHKDAKACWQRLIPELVRVGMMAKIFEGVAAAYCMAFGRWVEAERVLRRKGQNLVLTTKTGYPMQNPWLNIAGANMKLMQSFGSDLGLTPAALAKVAAIKAPAQGDLFEGDDDDAAAGPADDDDGFDDYLEHADVKGTA